MSGMYPPGVTGNEYQIAGGTPVPKFQGRCDGYLDEIRVQTKDAHERIDYLISILDGQILLPRGTDQVGRAKIRLLEWQKELDEMPLAYDVECGFDGEVDEAEAYNGVIMWTCPRCEKEHEEDVPEQEWDDDRV